MSTTHATGTVRHDFSILTSESGFSRLFSSSNAGSRNDELIINFNKALEEIKKDWSIRTEDWTGALRNLIKAYAEFSDKFDVSSAQPLFERLALVLIKESADPWTEVVECRNKGHGNGMVQDYFKQYLHPSDSEAERRREQLNAYMCKSIKNVLDDEERSLKMVISRYKTADEIRNRRGASLMALAILKYKSVAEEFMYRNCDNYWPKTTGERWALALTHITTSYSSSILS